MVAAEIPKRRRNSVTAYRHFGSMQPEDLEQALEDVAAALRSVRLAGEDKEARALAILGVHLSGLRERLDATSVDVAVRLRRHRITLVGIALALGTARPTIEGWFRLLAETDKETP